MSMDNYGHESTCPLSPCICEVGMAEYMAELHDEHVGGAHVDEPVPDCPRCPYVMEGDLHNMMPKCSVCGVGVYALQLDKRGRCPDCARLS